MKKEKNNSIHKNLFINDSRKDLYGNIIEKGGKHKVSFKDDIKGNFLVELTIYHSDENCLKRKEYIKRLREQNIRLEDQHNSEQKKWYINLQDEIKRLEELRNKDKINYENDLTQLANKYDKLIEEKEKYWKENIDKLNDEF